MLQNAIIFYQDYRQCYQREVSFFIAQSYLTLKSVFLQSEHVCMHASTMQVRWRAEERGY